MPEEVVRGRSLDEIRQEWADKYNRLPEDLAIEVIDKPSLFSRQWKVRLLWDEPVPTTPLTPSLVRWDETKYIFAFGEGVTTVIPYLPSGEIWLNGEVQEKSFHVALGDHVEFHPVAQAGQLTWEIEVRLHGLSVVGKIRHEQPGHYVLPKEIPAVQVIDLAQYVIWEGFTAQGEYWDENRLNADLEKLMVVHGRRLEAWSEILAVKGVQEVVIAEATLPVPPVPSQLEDFVGAPQMFLDGEEKVDFFASKVQLVAEGAVLARKVQGQAGLPGKDVLGKAIPAAPFKDFQLRLKKNVNLSDDGTEVIASCAGQPVRLDEFTYMVENVYVLHRDVDLETGSIEFPGDVYIDGNVQDGLHVFAGGKIEIMGSVSHAEIRAEKGAKIHKNVLGGKVVVGEKYVFRSELLRNLSELHEQINVSLRQTVELVKSPGAVHLKPGQCLKLVLEKQFPELPKLSAHVEKFVLDHKEDEMVTEGLIVSLRTAKRFLAGLGPLELQSLPFLQRVDKALEQFVQNMTLELPEKLSFVVNYVQGATIECGGSLECQKGAYNSDIRVDGDLSIESVCRGGKIFAGGKVNIRELGGSGVSMTFVQISPDSQLKVTYCHPNVIIAVGKEIIRIEEAYRQLEIYREKGRVQVEKLRVNPL